MCEYGVEVLSKDAILMDYTPLNVNGHYSLDLAVPEERYRLGVTSDSAIAAEIVATNARITKLVEKNKLFDRSRNGNKGCFRNEMLQYKPLTIAADWKLPKAGLLEFDFIYLYQSRDQAPLKDSQFDSLLSAMSRSKSSITTKIKVSPLSIKSPR